MDMTLTQCSQFIALNAFRDSSRPAKEGLRYAIVDNVVLIITKRHADPPRLQRSKALLVIQDPDQKPGESLCVLLCCTHVAHRY